MPSFTNQLESAHGHMNDVTPRRNTFLSSNKRIIEPFILPIIIFHLFLNKTIQDTKGRLKTLFEIH